MPPRGYTLKEKKEILQYIIRKNAFQSIKGRKIWIDYTKTGLTNRTWQSLKEVFKGILKDIRNPYYALSEDIVREFESSSKLTNNSTSWVCTKPSTFKNPHNEESSEVTIVESDSSDTEEYITSAVLDDNIRLTSTPNKKINGNTKSNDCIENTPKNTDLPKEQDAQQTSYNSINISSDEGSNTSENDSMSQPLFVLYKNKLRPVFFGTDDDYEQCYIDPIAMKQKLMKKNRRDKYKLCCPSIERLYLEHCLRYINEGKVGPKPSKYYYTKHVINMKHEKGCKHEKASDLKLTSDQDFLKKKRPRLPIYLDSEGNQAEQKICMADEEWKKRYLAEKIRNEKLMKMIAKNRNDNLSTSTSELPKKKSNIQVSAMETEQDIAEKSMELNSQNTDERVTSNDLKHPKLGINQMVEIMNIEEICTPGLDVDNVQMHILDSVLDEEKLHNDKQKLYSTLDIENMLVEDNQQESSIGGKNKDRNTVSSENAVVSQCEDPKSIVNEENGDLKKQTESFQKTAEEKSNVKDNNENEIEQSESKSKERKVISKSKKMSLQRFILKPDEIDKSLRKKSTSSGNTKRRTSKRISLKNADQSLNTDLDRSPIKINSDSIQQSTKNSKDNSSLSKYTASLATPVTSTPLNESSNPNLENNFGMSNSTISLSGPSESEKNYLLKTKLESSTSTDSTQIFDESYYSSLFWNKELKMKRKCMSFEKTLIYSENLKHLKDSNENTLKHSVIDILDDDIEPKDDWKLLSTSDVYNNLELNRILNQTEQSNSDIFSDFPSNNNNNEEMQSIKYMPKIHIHDILPRTISDVMTEEEN